MFLRLFPLMMISLPLLTGEACGLVGGAKLASGDIARAVVGLVGPNNKTFCTATVVAHNVVLSAGHCLQAGTSYRVQYKSNGLRQFSDVLDWVMPPQFDPQVLPVVADLALVRYSTPLSPEIGVATLGLNEPPAWPGDQVTVVGGGIAFKGLNETGFNRMATLTVALGAFGDQQIRLVDSSGRPTPIGACAGDSGSPVFEIKPEGPKVVAVVSWAAGPNGTKGCGGMTGATPLSPFRQWIQDTMRSIN